MSENILNDIKNWVPIRFYLENNEPYLDWCFTNNIQFTDIFWDETIEEILENHFCKFFRPQTSFQFLQDKINTIDYLIPNGFIFHTSHCGSSLLLRLISNIQQSIIISEASIINSIIHYQINNPNKISNNISYLNLICNILCQKFNEKEECSIIKFNPWHLLEFYFIKDTFPNTPCLFLYRNPLEVLASYFMNEGFAFCPLVPLFYGTNNNIKNIFDKSVSDLTLLYGSILNIHNRNLNSKNILIMDYSNLIKNLDLIFSFLNIKQKNIDLENILKFDAKNQETIFRNDNEEKQNLTKNKFDDLSNSHLIELYNNLNEISAK